MKFIFSLLIMALFAPSAIACTASPLGWRVNLINAGIALVATKIDRRLDSGTVRVRLIATQVLKYDWVESDQSFECHDYEELLFTFAANYLADDGVGRCHGKYTYLIKQGFYKGAPPKFERVKLIGQSACAIAPQAR